ncbi:MAG: serine hydrolase [Pseudomonadota bacterium]
MRKFLKWVGIVCLGLVLVIGAAALWKREEINRLLAVNSLFYTDKIVANFSNMRGAFLHQSLPRGDGPVSPMPASPSPYTLTSDQMAWLTDDNATSFLVLKDGAVVFEDYYQGTTPDDLRISWSMAKSYLSVLFGMMIDQGHIASLDDPVVTYAPALATSAYQSATIRNVLQMSSGVAFDEDYFDPNSDINKMGRVLALGGSMDDFSTAITETKRPAGARFQYVSIDTHVLGMVLRGATGQSLSDLMTTHVIAPLGLEADPYYVTDGYGVAFALGGLNLRTRDYARFAQMVAQRGEWQGTQIVPQDWIDASITPSARTDPGSIRYGYQWWIPQIYGPGEVLAIGVYGQYIYINQTENVVIVRTASDHDFRKDAVQQRAYAMFQSIAQDLAQ